MNIYSVRILGILLDAATWWLLAIRQYDSGRTNFSIIFMEENTREIIFELVLMHRISRKQNT